MEMIKLITNYVAGFAGQLPRTFASVSLVTGVLLGFGATPVQAYSVSGVVTSTKLSVTVAETDSILGEHGPERPPTIRETLLQVCTDRGYGEDCAKTLYGMAWKESQFISTAVGDNGRARGWFQIHYRLHRITSACAEDLACSADWTISYLESNGYPKYKNYAVQCHNGCRVANGYAASALRHGNRLWAVADAAEAEAKKAAEAEKAAAAAEALAQAPETAVADTSGADAEDSKLPARDFTLAGRQDAIVARR